MKDRDHTVAAVEIVTRDLYRTLCKYDMADISDIKKMEIATSAIVSLLANHLNEDVRERSHCDSESLCRSLDMIVEEIKKLLRKNDNIKPNKLEN